MECLLAFVVVAVVLSLIGFGWAQEKKRREELLAWTSAHNLRFNPDKEYNYDDRLPGFKCLKQGSNRYAYNIISGEWDGRTLLAFDYHYETHSTDSKGRHQTHHHHFSSVLLRSDLTLKPLVIRAENLFDKLAGFVGFDDIDFESAEFSRMFYVSSPDRRWAYDVLHPRTMQFLLDSPRFSIEFDTGSVMAWRSGRMDVANREAAIRVIDGILDGLPEYVRQQAKLS